jgi:diaminohydroxyphosphoribosylaminopyrimidine deaminase/5-amino-6-(5-phosphoribosylamino)uracil reductase
VIGVLDPNPVVHSRGVAALRRAGIETTSGVEEAAAKDLIRFFQRHVVSGLPFVRLKLAASADGRIATRSGDSRWITGEEARRLAHRWRDELDAVMVGVDTVLVDDPALSCRRRGGRDPLRVIVDSRLRLPPTAKLFTAGRSPVWIATARTHDRRRAERLAARGATIVPVPDRDGKIDLRALFRVLGRRGIVSVLVEGGSRLAAALVRGRLVDELCWFTAPLLIGGDGIPMIGPLGVRTLRDAIRLEDLRVRQVGQDLLHSARPVQRR